MNKDRHEQNFDRNKEAIAPVLGEILMVAITVVMAAVVVSWGSGIKAPESPKTIGLDIVRHNETEISFTVTSIAMPGTELTNLTASFYNRSSLVKMAILGSGAPSNGSMRDDIITNYQTDACNVNVGDSALLMVRGLNEFIVIVANFGDGTKKAKYSNKV